MKSGETYRHFKGGTYTVILTGLRPLLPDGGPGTTQFEIMTAKLESTMDDVKIVMNSLFGLCLVPKQEMMGDLCLVYCSHYSGKLFVRSEKDFLEPVCKPEYMYVGPRFSLTTE